MQVLTGRVAERQKNLTKETSKPRGSLEVKYKVAKILMINLQTLILYEKLSTDTLNLLFYTVIEFWEFFSSYIYLNIFKTETFNILQKVYQEQFLQ